MLAQFLLEWMVKRKAADVILSAKALTTMGHILLSFPLEPGPSYPLCETTYGGWGQHLVYSIVIFPCKDIIDLELFTKGIPIS